MILFIVDADVINQNENIKLNENYIFQSQKTHKERKKEFCRSPIKSIFSIFFPQNIKIYRPDSEKTRHTNRKYLSINVFCNNFLNL